MSKLIWDQIGKRIYEVGVDRGVLYPINTATGTYPLGVAWNGLTKISENPSGAEASATYADNIKYLNLVSAEDFGATIEAFTYPDEFGVCNGEIEPVEGVIIGQQNRVAFGLSYRTLIGNDTENTDYGYKIHLVYGAMAAPSSKDRQTVNADPEAMTLSWEITTTPVSVSGFKPTATLTIDSTKTDAAKLAALEAILYGKDATTDPISAAVVARLPFPEEVFSIVGA